MRIKFIKYAVMNRLEQLHEFYREDPDDPLNLYMLALEYKNLDVTKSKELFLRLIREHSSYLPGYYITAELLFGLGETEESRKIAFDGIELARNRGDDKTLRELMNLYGEITS